ncbi:hypothetical protein ACWCRF_32290 [Streptomyces sp. NPDC002405]|uniref:hypothetical protein n=1 Tax=unclassified Streptomyces TaxID=2593676 RepID=UPI0036994E75
MRRYVHNELATVAEAVCTVALSTPVGFGVHGIPKADADWQAIPAVIALSAVLGVLACTRWTWLGGKKRDFERAVPLNPDTVLPARGESLRRSLDPGFVTVVVVPTLLLALFWEPWAALLPLIFVPDRLTGAAYAAYWERCYGVMLWQGHVPDQPLEDGQYLYSSVRRLVSWSAMRLPRIPPTAVVNHSGPDAGSYLCVHTNQAGVGPCCVPGGQVRRDLPESGRLPARLGLDTAHGLP